MHEPPGDDARAADIEPERLVRENIGWMLALAERILGERAAAEDAVQEAFVAALRGLADFEGRSRLQTWLHRITVNAALTRVRQRRRRPEQSIEDVLPRFDDEGCRIEPPWPALASTEDVLARDDLRARVVEGIAELPESYRIVLLLRDIQGYDTAEVAGLLDISLANVKVRLHRARAALKKLLEPVLRGEDVG